MRGTCAVDWGEQISGWRRRHLLVPHQIAAIFSQLELFSGLFNVRTLVSLLVLERILLWNIRIHTMSSAQEDSFDGIVVVGGGLVGCLSALMAARETGLPVRLYEGRVDWRRKIRDEGGTEQHKSNIKRSINLALSRRGQEALASVGLLEKVMKNVVPMRCRAMHSASSTKVDPEADSFQPYDEVDPSNCIYSVSREGLNTLLMDEAEAHPNVTIFFSHKLSHIDRNLVVNFETDPSKMQVPGLNTYNDYTPATVRVRARLVLGCDGAYSCTRESMLRLTRMDFSRRYIDHGYKELCIPPNPETGDFALKEHEALHIWPRGDFMMIGLPNLDKTFTCTLFAQQDDNVVLGEVVGPRSKNRRQIQVL